MTRQNLLAAIVAAVISTLGIGGFSIYQGSELNTYAQGYQSRVFNTLEELDKGDTAPYITTVFVNIGQSVSALPGLKYTVYSASFRSAKPYWNKARIESVVREKTGSVQAEVFFVINNRVLKNNENEFNTGTTSDK